MIEFLRGTLLKKENGHVVVDVNGVGYGLEVPLTALPSLPDVGQPVELLVYFHLQMAQGAAGISLFGFLTGRDRELFEVLLTAPGIGPSKAIDILSSIAGEDLVRAVLQGDLALLGRLKGIGKKTAEKLIVNLRDRMKRFALAHALPESAPPSGGRPGTGTRPEGAPPPPPGAGGAALREAVEALESLGVKPLVAERAARKAFEILGPEAEVAELIKEALKHRR